MRFTSSKNDEISVTLRKDDLAFLCNSINEALEAVEAWEFETRTGRTRERAAELLEQLNSALKKAS
jgi:hypothetical protein